VRLDRVVQHDRSVFTMASLSGTGGAPAAVADGADTAGARRASTCYGHSMVRDDHQPNCADRVNLSDALLMAGVVFA
jgi:hypothetical protein